MSNLQEHVADVLNDGEPCDSAHQDDLQKLKESFSDSDMHMRRAMMDDIRPEQLVIGGYRLGMYGHFKKRGISTAVFATDEDGRVSTHTLVTVERWVAEEQTVTRIARTAGESRDGQLTRMAYEQSVNKQGFPGSRQRRLMRLALFAVTEAPHTSVRTFALPRRMDDETFIRLRAGGMINQQTLEDGADAPIESHLISSNPQFAVRPDNVRNSAVDRVRQQLYSELTEELLAARRLGNHTTDSTLKSHIEAGFRTQNCELDEARVIAMQQLVLHEIIRDAYDATEGIRRIVPMLEYGRRIMPSRPQHEVGRVVKSSHVSD